MDLTGVIAIATARMTSSQTSCKDIGLSVPFFFFWVFFFLFVSCLILFLSFAERKLKLEPIAESFHFMIIWWDVVGTQSHCMRLLTVRFLGFLRGPNRKRGLKRETCCVSSLERASMVYDKKKGNIIIKTKELLPNRKHDWREMKCRGLNRGS